MCVSGRTVLWRLLRDLGISMLGHLTNVERSRNKDMSLYAHVVPAVRVRRWQLDGCEARGFKQLDVLIWFDWVLGLCFDDTLG